MSFHFSTKLKHDNTHVDISYVVTHAVLRARRLAHEFPVLFGLGARTNAHQKAFGPFTQPLFKLTDFEMMNFVLGSCDIIYYNETYKSYYEFPELRVI